MQLQQRGVKIRLFLQYECHKYLIIMYLKLFALFLAAANAYFQLSLSGGILDSYYIATIYVGSPPQPRDVLIDTGSQLLTINCQVCTTCSVHPHPYFNRADSSSQQYVPCETNSPYCTQCDSPQKQCAYDITYYDNSSTAGVIFQDIVSVTGDSSSAVLVKLGCVSEASRQFAGDQKIDGLWGLRKGNTLESTSNRTDKYLVQASKLAGSPRCLSICLSFYGGKMVIGGVDNSLHTQPGVTFSYDNASTDYFGRSLGRVKLGDQIIHENAGQLMPDIIIDSGASASLLDSKFHDQIVKSMESICQNLGSNCKYVGNNIAGSKGDIYCLALSDAVYLSSFPNITLTLAAQEVTWKASQYLVLNSANTNNFCLNAVSSNSGFVLGNDFMINKDIVFGDQSVTIYPESQCGSQLPPYRESLQVSESREAQSGSSITKGMAVGIAVSIIASLLFGVLVAKYCGKKTAQEQTRKKTQIQNEIKFEEAPVTEVRQLSEKEVPIQSN